MRAASAVSRAKGNKKTAHEHTGQRRLFRHSLRNGFTAYSGLSLATGSVCHHHRRDAKHRRQLDASVGASGPHGFAVRASATRLEAPRRPPHPAPTSVTIAIRPSWQGRDGARYRLIWVFGKTEIISKKGWTAEPKHVVANQFGADTSDRASWRVMPAPVAGIHVLFFLEGKAADGRDEARP